MTEQNTADAAGAAAPADAPEAGVPAEAAAPAVDAADAAGAAGAVDAAGAAPQGRRRRAAVLRWAAAAVAFAAVGAGTAYGITRAERTDLPGLATEGDGRWAYPALAKPALPAGAPLAKGPDNKAETHYAPLAALLLPPPAGARPDPGLKADKDQLVSADAFLEEYEPDARPKLKEGLEYDGLRQIAARGWTMPDGTRTRVYLLRFHSAGFVDAFRGCDTNTRLAGAPALELDLAWREAKTQQAGLDAQILGPDGAGTLDSTDVTLYQEVKPGTGEEQSRLGCLRAGDVLGVLVQSRKGGAATVPFHQTVVLQSQLLG